MCKLPLCLKLPHPFFSKSLVVAAVYTVMLMTPDALQVWFLSL